MIISIFPNLMPRYNFRLGHIHLSRFSDEEVDSKFGLGEVILEFEEDVVIDIHAVALEL
jgi:hypothetical protein